MTILWLILWFGYLALWGSQPVIALLITIGVICIAFSGNGSSSGYSSGSSRGSSYGENTYHSDRRAHERREEDWARSNEQRHRKRESFNNYRSSMDNVMKRAADNGVNFAGSRNRRSRSGSSGRSSGFGGGKSRGGGGGRSF